MPTFAMPVPPHWSTQGPLRRTLLDPQQEYLAFARQLLALIKDGHGDSEEALRLRASMDGPWARMTFEQQMRVGGVIEDLDRETDPRVRLRITR